MYAVIKSGGKQYKVKKDDIVDLELLSETDSKKELILKEVLLISDADKVNVGRPFIKGAKVIAELIGVVKDKKVIAFKYKRRKSSKKKIGHRQRYARVRIKDILSKDE